MLRVTWRNLMARKIRLALSAFAIVLGVAFVAGSFIFTDTLGGAFDGIIKGTTADVEIAPKGAGDFDSGQDTRTIPGSVLEELKALPGAEAAYGTDSVQGVFVIAKDGDLVGGQGAPGLSFNYNETKSITGEQIITLTSGELPQGTDQIALDEKTADKGGYSIGDEVSLVTPGDPPTMKATLTGLVHFGSEGGLAGATLTMFDTQGIQDLFFGGKDVYTGISLTTADGVSQTELRDAAQPLLPDGIEARTGDAVAKQGTEDIGEILGFINTFLLVFAVIAVVVCTFLIINTFSILVAQRSRELALLRALGASKRQVTRAVLLEALTVGLIGSTIGLGAGYLLANGLKALFGLFGLDIGEASMPIELRTVIVSYVVGLLVTLIAAYLPARRAARIPPVAAMRDDIALPEASLRRRMYVGGAGVVIGIGLIALGFSSSGSNGLLGIGVGALAILIGVALMSPVLGRPIIRLIGVFYERVFGTVGKLAAQNSLRNPRRTAATASALMIGLTLVALMSVIGQSTKVSTDRAISKTLTSQLVVSSVSGNTFSTAFADEIRGINGVDVVAQFRTPFGAEIDGSDAFIGAADPDQLAKALNIQVAAGAFGTLDDKGIFIDANVAKDKDYAVGDTVDLKLQGGTQKLTVDGTFAGNSMPTQYLVTLKALENGGLAPQDSYLFITTDDSADVSTVRKEIDTILDPVPTVTLKDQEEFLAEQRAQIDQVLSIIYALLGLAVIIAVLGIINTLALSVIERTREVGLLRAIGVSRRQLRRMVRLESVIISVLGAVLGVIMGVVFGVALQRAIADEGVDVLSIPWTQLIIFVVISAIVGVLAAVLPARRAAKLNVLDAITTE